MYNTNERPIQFGFSDRRRQCFFTGHRDLPEQEIGNIRNLLRAEILKMTDKGVYNFLNGGAMGFDLLAADEVLKLRRQMPEIRLYMYYPYVEQAKYFSSEAKRMWQRTLREADGYVYITPSYSKAAYHMRNHAMADDAVYCIAYCTETTGGTASTVKYAEKKGCKIFNLAEEIFWKGLD